MAELFPGRPDVLENTQRVADLCEFDFEKKYFLPEFPLPEDVESDNDLLVRLATEGARRRYGDELPAEVEERLSYELGVITRCGYASYFLIVHDFIQAAKQRGIPVGPGRGSAAGSVVAYGLEITNVDPLQFDLLFERFLNPERISMPDIDVDFCFERRSEVIDYVRQRYGHKSVGKIITFGTLKARAAVRDIARVLRVSPADADRIAKLIPSGPGFAMSVADAVKKVPELAHLVREDATIERLADLAQRIEGLSRHASVHAAGIVIAPGPLDEYVPVCTPPQQRNTNGDGEDAIITQFDMIALEKVGMLKMDFLGLRTLTVIHDAVEMIEQRHGVELDIDAVDLDDPDTYAMLREGRTAGVFQFESPLATEMLYQMRVDRFDDLVATNALVRPGPLDSGMHQVYTRRKRGEEEVRYPHPDLREVLEPTYGVIIYQEQVMRIANILAGYSLAEADVLRKAVGKKIQELIEAELDSFVERAVERGYKRHLIEDIAGQIQTFGRYGFNKSHSVAYSIISFQTAWLKAHYPGEFMAALLSSEIGDTDKVVAYINEAREMGIEVLPPSVNESGWKFTVVGDGQLRFGLGAVRNVGRGAIESIIGGREEGGPYTSLTEFCERVDLRLCNKRVVDSLISAGALDQADTHRAQLSAALDQALSEAQLRQADRASGQASLFGDAKAPQAATPPRMPDVVPWTEAERLAKEKEVVGFFISGHPLERFREEAHLLGTRTTATLGTWSEHRVTAAIVVTAVKRRISKKTGAEYARLTLEDFHGTAEALVFPDTWSKLSEVIVPDAALLLTGGHSPRDRGEDRAPFIVDDAQPLAGLRESGSIGVALEWRAGGGPDGDAARALNALCAAHPGPAPVFVEWSDGNGVTAHLRARGAQVALDEDFLGALRELVGTERVRLVRAQ
jgi:DNA polymerase-3 subunit alpha